MRVAAARETMDSPRHDPGETAPPGSSHRAKLVILRRNARLFEVAAAMKDNHVGSVLIVDAHHHLSGIVTDRDLALSLCRPDIDPREAPVSEVMTSVVGTCEEGASVADVLCAMKQFACRRVPLTRAGRPVGLVTLDDLIVEGAVTTEQAREIVEAQLGLPARLKPRGSLRPGAPIDEPALSTRREERSREQSYRDLVRDVEERAGLSSRERAEAAVRIVLGMICLRLHPEDAGRLTAALPVQLRDHVAAFAEAPAEPITVDTIGDALKDRLSLPPDTAIDILLSVCDAIGDGEDCAPGGRLRWYVRELFPRRAR